MTRAAHLLRIVLVATAALAPVAALADAVVTRCSADDEPTADIDLGKAIAGGGRVTFACPAGTVIRITRRHIVATETRIDGGGKVTLDAGGTAAVFDVSDARIVLGLSNIVIRNARPSGFAKGGVVSGRATVELVKSTLSNTTAAFNLVEGSVNLVDSNIGDGQGVAISAPNVTLLRSRIRGALLQPIVSSGGTVSIADSTIVGGGSSTFDSCTLDIRNSTISMSGATAIVSGCGTSISKTDFTDNRGAQGGALYLRKTASSLSIRGGSFVNNIADNAGGAIALEPAEIDDRVVDIRDVSFESNRAPNGGAIHLGGFIENSIVLTGRALLFANNTAAQAGGAIAGTNAGVRLTRTVFSGNRAGARGGAIELIFFGPRPSFVANSIFNGNSAPEGSVFRGSSLQFINDSIAGNQGGTAIAPFSPTADPGHPESWRLIAFRNTALVGNAPAACVTGLFAAIYRDAGHNLQFPASSSCPASIAVGDPGFDSMFVPALRGPADGQGDLATCVAQPVNGSDLYGRHRPQGKSCTIGAVEGWIEDAVLQRNPRFNNLPKTTPGHDGGAQSCPCEGNGNANGGGSTTVTPPPTTTVTNLPLPDAATTNPPPGTSTSTTDQPPPDTSTTTGASPGTSTTDRPPRPR